MSESLLNPDLDRAALRERFLRDGRVQVESVLRPDFADAVHDGLAGPVPWRLMYYNHDGQGAEVVGRLEPEKRRALGPAGLAELEQRVVEQARDRFQYYYEAYDVLDARRRGLDPQPYLQRFLDFMGSDELFEFIADISGDTQFNRVDCHACRYGPGHFLKEHADISPFEQRRMAYVFYFTRDWHADFGGITCFLDDQGRIEDALLPGYNSLTLFRVPVAHNVTQVAAFAPRPRHSITGWFTRYG
ncbi:MAG: 2OG-Fe(II) oxygenase family protein [Gammaproteobacteria bacterium]